jgi:hypothetical protein
MPNVTLRHAREKLLDGDHAGAFAVPDTHRRKGGRVAAGIRRAASSFSVGRLPQG